MAPKRSVMSSETIPILIKEVQARECVWNPEDPKYNDRYHVLSAWKAIANVTEWPEDALKMKWKNLRDLFRRELKKCDSLSVEEYKGRWKYFDSLSFLHKACAVSVDDYEEILDDSNPLETLVKFEPSEEPDEPEEHEEPEEPEEPEKNPISLEEEEEYIPEKRRKYSEDDYDMMYLKSLTPYFSQLEPIRKLVARSKIQDILLNEIAAQNSAERLNKLKKL